VLEGCRDRLVQPGFADLDAGGLVRSDQLALVDQLREERRGCERTPVREAALGEDSKDASLETNDPAIWVSERSRLEVGGRASGQLGVPSSSGRLGRKTPRMRRQYSFAVTAAAATPPAIIWRTRLPVPGSM